MSGKDERANGREDKKANDLFYTCSLIEFIARATKNSSRFVVNKLGKERLQKIYDLADVYHCDNIEAVCDEFIEATKIENGNYDTVARAEYSVPTCWDIGKIYKRLILIVAKEKNISVIDSLLEIYNSFISEKIDDYNCAFYYDTPDYMYLCYTEGKVA